MSVKEREAGVDRSRAKEFAHKARTSFFIRAVGKGRVKGMKEAHWKDEATPNPKTKRRFSRRAEGFDQQPRTERP